MLLEDFQEKNYFDATTTGMPTPDDMMRDPEYFREKKGKIFDIIHMSPDEYMEAVARNFGSMAQAMSGVERNLVDEYAERMANGEKAPMLTLDYRDGGFSQEGRNRAMAAKKLGATRIPVMVLKDAPK